MINYSFLRNSIVCASIAASERRIANFLGIPHLEYLYKIYDSLWKKYGNDYNDSYIKRFRYFKRSNTFSFKTVKTVERKYSTNTTEKEIVKFSYPKDRKLLRKDELIRYEFLTRAIDCGIDLIPEDLEFVISTNYQLEINVALNEFYEKNEKKINSFSQKKLQNKTAIREMIKSSKDKTIVIINKIVATRDADLKEYIEK